MPGRTALGALAVALMGAGVAAQSAAPDRRMRYGRGARSGLHACIDGIVRY